MTRHLPGSLRRRWRILLPLMLLILGCGPTAQPLQGNIITLLGHTDILQPGATVTIPLLVQDVGTRRPSPNVKIDVGIGADLNSAAPLFSGRTGLDGTVLASFTVPDGLADPNQFLVVRSDVALFSGSGGALTQGAYTQPVYVGPAYNMLLSTDKPRYQPGQTLHVRVLVLDKLALRPAQGQAVRLRIQEPDGILLADQTVTLSDWGIGSLDLPLDERAGSGEYRILATLGAVESTRTVTVEPYTLPRFEIAFTTDAAYYDIEATIQAHVTATYFFGKPVANAQVEVSGALLPTQTGVTDANGDLDLTFPVPDYYFDTLEQGTAKMALTVKVTDAAGHPEESSEEVLLTASPLIIDAVAESGFLRPGMENLVYLEVSQPDGTPVQASLTISASVLSETQTLETDEFGLAVLRITPTGGADLSLTITATANTETGPIEMDETLRLGGTLTPAALLVRPDRAEYQVGDTIAVQILASGKVETVYLDLSKEGQSVDLRAVSLTDGRAEVSIPVDGSLLGVLEINAYAIVDRTVVSDRRLALINPGAVAISVEMDAETYRPGGRAALTVQTQVDGQPVPAALGISIVDESLYAVENMDPGFIRTYFLLRKEMLDLPYQVGGFAPFDTNVPVPDLPAGIRTAANHALMGALAQELSLEKSAPPIDADHQGAKTASLADRLLAGMGAWSMKSALILPLLGVGLWDGRRRRRLLNLLIFGLLVGLSLIWVSCAAAPSPAAAPAFDGMAQSAASAAEAPFGFDTTATQQGAGAEPPRIRQFFPETLFWLPELVTDEAGRAQIDVPLADSITTWRVGVVASTQDGLLGSAQTDLRVFQDFFVEPDLPLTYVAGDALDVRVSLFNYLDKAQDVTLSVDGGAWLLVSEDAATQTIRLSANEVTSATLPIRLLEAGTHTLRFTAQGSQMSDIVERELRVTPAGRLTIIPFSGVLARSVDERFTVTPLAAEQPQVLTLRLYGSQAAQYAPDVADVFYKDECPPYDEAWLAVLKADYLQTVGQWTPQQQFLTEQYLQRAYRRTLRFYNAIDQGFSNDCFLIFRGAADSVGSASALVSLMQMGKLIYVDPLLIQRAQAYVLANQKADGSWNDEPDGSFWGYYGWDESTRAVRQTAEIVWRLSEAGFASSEPVQRGLAFLDTQDWQDRDRYWGDVSVQILNARLLADAKDVQAVAALTTGLQEISTQQQVYGLEPYALAALRAAGFQDEAQQLVARMTRPGPVSSWVDPASIMAMLALVENAKTQRVTPDAGIRALVNGQEVASFEITPQNAYLLQQQVITGALAALQSGENVLQLRLRGDYVSAYAAEWRYYVPWQSYKPQAGEELGPLVLTVDYAAQRATVGELIPVTATVTNVGASPTGELILELALPAGFHALESDFQRMNGDGVIRDYLITPGRIIVRLAPLDGSPNPTAYPAPQDGQAVEPNTILTFYVTADYTGQVKIPTSRVYQLVTPDEQAQFGADGVLTIE